MMHLDPRTMVERPPNEIYHGLLIIALFFLRDESSLPLHILKLSYWKTMTFAACFSLFELQEFIICEIF